MPLLYIPIPFLKKRVLHISHLYPSVKGPFIGTFMGELNESLTNLYEVSFLIPTPIIIPFTKRWSVYRSKLIHTNAKRVRYWSVPKRKFPSLSKRSLLNQMLDEIETTEADLIQVHWAYPEILLFPEIKKLGKPVFLTFHGSIFYTVFENPILLPHLKIAINSADKIIAVGNQLKNDIISYFPDQKHKVFQIANGINQNKFFIDDKISARKLLGFEQNKIHILCVAGVANKKGIDILVRSVIESDHLKNHCVHIVGRTLEHSFMEELKSVIKENNIDNIIFHGPVPHHELAKYYQASDVFALPSRVEGFGVALVEAGMCGLPLVSTYSGGPEEIVTDEVGLLAQVGDVTDFKNKLETLTNNLTNYNPQDIRQIMIERYSQSVIVKNIEQHYEECFQ